MCVCVYVRVHEAWAALPASYLQRSGGGGWTEGWQHGACLSHSAQLSNPIPLQGTGSVHALRQTCSLKMLYVSLLNICVV